MATKPWSGRFNERTDQRIEQFTESISFDHRLFKQDIQASTSHARMLEHVGLISEEECQQIVRCLSEIEAEIQNGNFLFTSEREDIHMHVEAALVEKLGDLGRKLHTGRSRNDQVATDLKLWVRDAANRLDRGLLGFQRALVTTASRYRNEIIPGYTHMQPAQPVLVAAFFPRLLRKGGARPHAIGRLSQAAQHIATWCCSVGWNEFTD